MDAMKHIRYLAETIGPRGSTTLQEKEAAKYVETALCNIGLNPVTEYFKSARSNWLPYVVFSALLLFSNSLFLTTGQIGAISALVISVFAFLSVLLHLAFLPNPLQLLLPKGKSQNVHAKLTSKTKTLQHVVLLGHLDTHRTPLVFSTSKWLKFFSLLVPMGLISSVMLVCFFAIGVVSNATLWRLLTLPFGLFILILLILSLQADFTQYAHGANDNASGAGIVLELAESLKSQALENTTVWTVLTGCEEVGCYGAETFARNHKDELGNAIWITIDNVGGAGAGPAYLTEEQFLFKTKSDPDLIALADEISREYQQLDAYSHTFSGAYTEGLIGAKFGFRVLTFVGHRRDGVLPNWHQTTDVLEHIDPDVVQRTTEFLWLYLNKLDAISSEKL